MIDLHLHLDGSLPIAVAKEIMLSQYSELDDDLKRVAYNESILENYLVSNLQVSEQCDSLTSYLNCFSLPLKLLQTESSIKKAVKGLLEDLKSEGMRYVEIRFAPQLHSKSFLDLDEKYFHEAAIVKAAVDASREIRGIKCNFILCLMRGGDKYANMRTLRLAEAFKNRGVVAVDLAGDEAKYSTSKYRYEFGIAKEMGLDFIIHAGEAGNLVSRGVSVKNAISYGAKRIGHGIALCAHGELMHMCKEYGIGVECCPTSNIQTKAVSCIEDHPIYIFMNEGIKASVNTDNRTVSNTTIENEFNILRVSEEEKKLLIQNAIDMAFLSEEEKKMIFPEWVK